MEIAASVQFASYCASYVFISFLFPSAPTGSITHFIYFGIAITDRSDLINILPGEWFISNKLKNQLWQTDYPIQLAA